MAAQGQAGHQQVLSNCTEHHLFLFTFSPHSPLFITIITTIIIVTVIIITIIIYIFVSIIEPLLTQEEFYILCPTNSPPHCGEGSGGMSKGLHGTESPAGVKP